MNLILNGKPHQTGSLKLIELLRELGLNEPKGMAIAINDRVIPKSTWNVHDLKPNDRIEIIRATQGG